MKNGLVKKAIVGAGIVLSGFLPMKNSYSQKTPEQFVEGDYYSIGSQEAIKDSITANKVHGIWYGVEKTKDGKLKFHDLETAGRYKYHHETEPSKIIYSPNLTFVEKNVMKNGEPVDAVRLSPAGYFAVSAEGMETILDEQEKKHKKDASYNDQGFKTSIPSSEVSQRYLVFDMSTGEHFFPYCKFSEIDSSLADTTTLVLPFAGIPVSGTKEETDWKGNISLTNDNNIMMYVVEPNSPGLKDSAMIEDFNKRLADYPDLKNTTFSTKPTGQIYEFFEVEGEEKVPKEKKDLNIHGRLKLGVGITDPEGYLISINPQIQISNKGYLGIEGFWTNSSKNLEKITKEEGFRQLVSLPAEMYFVNTGTETTENTEIKNDFGLGFNLSYVNPSLELNVKAGTIGQKAKKVLQTMGEEYMEIGGEKDAESVYNYDETNTSVTDKPLFEGSPVYFGAGGEYKFNCLKNKILKNLSVGGDFIYITGDNSETLGSLKLIYNIK